MIVQFPHVLHKLSKMTCLQVKTDKLQCLSAVVARFAENDTMQSRTNKKDTDVVILTDFSFRRYHLE